MDCYPEYHNHYQHHYNNLHNTYFSTNNNPSMHRFGSAQSSNENQQLPFYEGFSRHNLHSHHHSSNYSGQGSFSPFDSSNESSQFYYPNVHHQPPPTSSYYGNHHHHSPHFPHQNTYDSYPYRNLPSNYRTYHTPPSYGYQHYPPHLQNHSPHHFYPLQQPQQQQQQQQQQQPYNSNSTEHHYSPHYPAPSQQQDFNSPTNSTRSNDFSTSSQSSPFNNTTSQQLDGRNSEKLQDKDAKHIDDSTTISTTNVVKMDDDRTSNNTPIDDQQVSVVNPSSQESSSIEKHDENTNASKDTPKDEKAINKNKNEDNNNNTDDEEVAKKHKNDSFNENENCKENQQHTQQKNEEATSATDYSPETCKVNKIPEQENEKQQNMAAVNRSNEHHSLPHLNDRSTTPIHYNSQNNLPPAHNFSHKRYPLSWYTQHEYYNNWMMSSPDDRRPFPDSHSFFSSMRSKNKNPEKHKMQNELAPTKRTKRKPKKIEEPVPKVDPIMDKMKNVTPLPGFLQTFGQTEIGKFSEAFYTSDSPHHYYNNIESDIDSPQLDWDSLDGPIGNPMPTQVASSFYMYGSENDSPISSFSEIMCKDF